jgi:lipopolysaccharide export system permease protein
MKILDKYIFRNFIYTVIFVLFVLSIISVVIDYTEKVDSFVSKHVPGKEILGYYFSFIPFITAFLFPIFVFIAVIFFTTRLTAKSEIIAMLNSGMSFNRFLYPYIWGGVLFSGILLYANHVWIPLANKKRIAFENKYITFNPIKSGADMHFRISTTEFIYLKGYNPKGNDGYNFCYEVIENHQLKRKLWAETIKWDSLKKEWNLNAIQERTWNGDAETYKTYPTLQHKFGFTPADVVEVVEQKQAMTTKELRAFIAREQHKGNPALNVYKVELYRRSGAPFSVFILTIIGACMASFKVRGGSGLHLALGILISGAYIIFMQFSTTFSIKGSLSPLVSVWIPNALFAGLAYWIYKKYKG